MINYEMLKEELNIIQHLYVDNKIKFKDGWEDTYYIEMDMYKNLGLFQTISFIITKYWDIK